MSGLATIARNTAVSAGGEVLSKLASLVFYVVLARELGRTGFGQYMFALSLVVLLTSLAGFGTDPLLTRAVARERRTLHELFWNAIALKVALGLGSGVLAVVVSVLNGYGAAVQATVAVLTLGVIAELCSKTFAATFLAYDDLRPVAAGLVLQRFSTAIVGVTALVAGAGIVPVAFIYLGGALLGLAYVARALRRRDIRPRRELSLARARRLAADSVPFGLKLIFSTAIFRIDSTILSLMKGGAAVGLYSAAYRALESTLFVTYSFEAALFPTFSRLSRNSDPPLARIYELALKAVVALMAPVGLLFLLYGGPILKLLYGAQYAGATRALQWLGGAAALYGISFISSSLIVAQGRARWLAWATGLIMLENVVLNLIVIPRYSLTGAAAVTTITEITQVVALGLFALRLVGRVSPLRIFGGPVVASAVMAAVALAAPRTVPMAVAAFAVYAAAALVAERLLFPADLARFGAAVRRRLARA